MRAWPRERQEREGGDSEEPSPSREGEVVGVERQAVVASPRVLRYPAAQVGVRGGHPSVFIASWPSCRALV